MIPSRNRYQWLQIAAALDKHPQRNLSAFLLFLSRLRMIVLAMPIAMTTPNTMASSGSAVDTSMAPMQLFLWWLVIFSACLLAVVIFHLVMVPVMNWFVRRFS